jgi:hypothetical protein
LRSLFILVVFFLSFLFSPFSLLDIQDDYSKWIERMKIPPQVVRDPLDMDWPTDLITIDYSSNPILLAQYLMKHPPNDNEPKLKHPIGPYLDISLLSSQQTSPLTKEQFEQIALEHFYVFDARFSKYQKEDQGITITNENGNEGF